MSGFEHVVDYTYPANFDSLEKVEGWAQDIWKQLSEAQHGFAEDFELALSQKWSFKTITGITNDVVADQQEDTLTLAATGGVLTIVGTAATDTITFDWTHLGIEDLTDPGADRIAFWDDSETAFKWLAPDGTTIEISGTTLQVLAGGVDHGGLSGLGDDDHLQYIKDSEFTQNSGFLVGTGAGTFQEETGATVRTSLGLTIGSDVQAWDADLDTYAGITPSANMQTFLANADFAAMMADLSGTTGAAFDWNTQNLTNIGTITATTGSTIGNLTLANGSITDSSGSISFGNENLRTTGISTLYGDIKTDRWLEQGSNTFVGVDIVGADWLEHTAASEGHYNTAMGYRALYALTKGYHNTAIGAQALYGLTTGYHNTAIGLNAGYTNTGGRYNTAMGMSALHNNTGNYNTAVGYFALYFNTSGANNVALGVYAGGYRADGVSVLQTPENSIYVGWHVKSGSGNPEDVITNEIVIGHDAIGHGSHSVTLGNTNIVTTILRGNVGITQTSFGTNATKTLALGTGVAPTTSPADAFQVYSKDIQAGEAAPHFRTEHGDIIKLYQQAHIADAPGDTTANNATTINAILVALENAGLLATS